MPVDEEIYKMVFKKYSKWMARVANGWVFRTGVPYDGWDFVNEPMMNTVEWMSKKNKNPVDKDWRKALYTNMKNYFIDEMRRINADKRIPPHLLLSLDAYMGDSDD